MNRAERRAAKKSKPGYLRNMTAADLQKRFVQNGITPKDLEDEYRRGWNHGFKTAGIEVVKGCYASICLALQEKHGFGRKRCRDVLQLVDEKLLYTLTSQEVIDEVWDKIGLKLEFTETFDRIQEVDT